MSDRAARERRRLLAQRDRIGSRLAWAERSRQRVDERVAALAVELADVDRRMLELGAEVPT
jgi:hypothetical protein